LLKCGPINDGSNSNSSRQIEGKWKRQKVQQIDFDPNLFEIIDTDMEIASQSQLGMCEDAFFFGYDPELKLIKGYKIADFDTIIADNLEYSTDLFYRNSYVMLNSLWEYYDNFVESNIENNLVKNEIERRINMKREKIA
jgi:hypothetical protein